MTTVFSFSKTFFVVWYKRLKQKKITDQWNHSVVSFLALKFSRSVHASFEVQVMTIIDYLATFSARNQKAKIVSSLHITNNKYAFINYFRLLI